MMSCSILPAFAWAVFLMMAMLLNAKESNAFSNMMTGFSRPSCPECQEGRVRKSGSCDSIFEKKECGLLVPPSPPPPPAPPPIPAETQLHLNETYMEEMYGEDWRNQTFEWGWNGMFEPLDCQPCSCACELDPGTVAWVTVCCLVPVILLLGCCWCCGCCCFRRRRLPQAQV